MERYLAPAGRPVLVLAHGAGAGESIPGCCGSPAGWPTRGVSVVTFDFPYMQAAGTRPDPRPFSRRRIEPSGKTSRGDAPAARRCFAGGKSMGGRIASQVAAANGFVPPPAGLVFFGYPLHPPDAPTKRRDAHLPAHRARRCCSFTARAIRSAARTRCRRSTATLPSSQLAARRRWRSLTAARRGDGESVDDAVGIARRLDLEAS